MKRLEIDTRDKIFDLSGIFLVKKKLLASYKRNFHTLSIGAKGKQIIFKNGFKRTDGSGVTAQPLRTFAGPLESNNPKSKNHQLMPWHLRKESPVLLGVPLWCGQECLLNSPWLRTWLCKTVMLHETAFTLNMECGQPKSVCIDHSHSNLTPA